MYGGIICGCCTESELSKNPGVNYYVNPSPQPRLGAGAGAVSPLLPASSGSLCDFLAVPLFMQFWTAVTAEAGRSSEDEQPG